MTSGIPRRVSACMLAFAVACAAAATARAQGDGTGPVDAALHARLRAAIAPADTLATLRGFTARGRVLPLVEGPVVTLRVAADLSGRNLREDARDARGSRTRRLAGRLAWEGSPRPAPADSAAAARIDALFHERVAPWEPAFTAPESLRVAGTTAEGWTRIVAAGAESARREWQADPETGRVLRMVDRTGRDGSPVEVEFTDWRETNGVAWPFRATTWTGGHAVRVTVWDRFEPSRDLSAEEFLPGQRSDL